MNIRIRRTASLALLLLVALPCTRIAAPFFVLRPMTVGAFMRLGLRTLATRPAVVGLFRAPPAGLSRVLLPAAIGFCLVAGRLVASMLI